MERTTEYIKWFISKHINAYLHFSKRMRERHNFIVSIVDYIELCEKYKFYLLGRSTVNKKREVGYLYFNRRQIHVIRDIKSKVLITVIPRYGKPSKFIRNKQS